MAQYLKDINHIATLEETQQAVDRCKHARDQFLIAVLYLTGARPVELVKVFKRKDVELTPNGGATFTLYTAKLKKKPGFFQPYRALEVALTAPFVTKYIIPYCQAYDLDREHIFFPYSPDRLRQIVYDVTQNTLCPYHFRHSRLWKIANDNPESGEYDLQRWKGGGNVGKYMANKPFGKKLVIK